MTWAKMLFVHTLFTLISVRNILALPLNSPLLPSYDYIGELANAIFRHRVLTKVKWSAADQQASR